MPIEPSHGIKIRRGFQAEHLIGILREALDGIFGSDGNGRKECLGLLLANGPKSGLESGARGNAVVRQAHDPAFERELQGGPAGKVPLG